MPLGDPGDAQLRLRLGDHQALLQAAGSSREMHDGVALAQAQLSLRLQGFLHVQLLRPGGLGKASLYDLPVGLDLLADPAGADLATEQLCLRNLGTAMLDLSGWWVQDAAPRRPHRDLFAAGRLLAPGASLCLFSGRGTDGPGAVYWGRRQAAWTNTGDVARLFDPDGIERARAEHVLPAPAAPPARARRRKA